MTDPFQPDRPMICPYNSSHSIATSRIQKHLVKCARNYPPDYKVSCPYNETHRLFKHEVQGHISNCPDHQHVDPSIYQRALAHSKHGAVMSSVNSDRRNVIDCHEKWDEDEGSFYELSSLANHQSATPLDPVRRVNQEQSFSEPSFVVPSIPLTFRENNRAPLGRAEALMMEQSGESAVEDTESVASFMGIGRGKPWNRPHSEIVMKIGRARGSAQAKMEI